MRFILYQFCPSSGQVSLCVSLCVCLSSLFDSVSFGSDQTKTQRTRSLWMLDVHHRSTRVYKYPARIQGIYCEYTQPTQSRHVTLLQSRGGTCRQEEGPAAGARSNQTTSLGADAWWTQPSSASSFELCLSFVNAGIFSILKNSARIYGHFHPDPGFIWVFEALCRVEPNKTEHISLSQVRV